MAQYNTLQEVFNKIWQTFVVEKAPQNSDQGRCKYTPVNEASKGCFIGIFLPLEIAKSWDSCKITNIDFFAHREEYKAIFDIDVEFLKELQSIHDIWTDSIKAIEYHADIAKYIGLKDFTKLEFNDYCKAALTHFANQCNLDIPKDI